MSLVVGVAIIVWALVLVLVWAVCATAAREDEAAVPAEEPSGAGLLAGGLSGATVPTISA
jgi:hypothetical protein